MFRWGAGWQLAGLLGCCVCLGWLGGCDAPAPPPRHGGSTAWILNPASVFKGAKAQALALAAQKGDVAEVRHLMRDEHVDPDHIFSYPKGEIPLLAWPILAQNPAGLKAMLDNGANPNARPPGHPARKLANGTVLNYCRYDSAMMWAAKAESPIYLKLLLAHGGNPNARTSNCESLLFQAFIWHGQWQNVQFLVEHGADVNVDDSHDPTTNGRAGNTILEDYTSYGDFDKAWWLIRHGADPHWPSWKHADGSPRYPVLEDIFWYPAKPSYRHWQIDDQCWALQHGYQRPPVMPDYYRQLRRELKYPYEEKAISLPDCTRQPGKSGDLLNQEHGHAATQGT